MHLGLDNIIKLQFTANVDICAILHVLNCLKVGSCCFKCIVILQIYFLKLSVSTFYKEINKSQQKVQS